MFKELAKANKSVRFVHVDVDKSRESMANELVHISTLPTYQVFKSGKMIHTFSEANPTKLRNTIGLLRQETTDAAATTKTSGETKQRHVKNNSKRGREKNKDEKSEMKESRLEKTETECETTSKENLNHELNSDDES